MLNVYYALLIISKVCIIPLGEPKSFMTTARHAGNFAALMV